jgi:hypothetical protein
LHSGLSAKIACLSDLSHSGDNDLTLSDFAGTFHFMIQTRITPFTSGLKWSGISMGIAQGFTDREGSERVFRRVLGGIANSASRLEGLNRIEMTWQFQNND